MNEERVSFLKKNKKEKRIVLITRFFIIGISLTIWELLSKFGIIDSFLLSSPSRILKTIINLDKSNIFYKHI